MTSPLDAPIDAAVLDLRGLEADNLLAFLALLGLLRTLEAVKPEWQPRVSWKGPPWVARLHAAENIDEQMVVLAAEDGLRLTKMALAPHAFVRSKSKKGRIETKGRKSIFSSAARVRRIKKLGTLAAQLAADRYQGRSQCRGVAACVRVDFLSSLAIEDVRRGDIVDSPFKLPSGQQAFVGAIYNSISRVLAPESQEDSKAIRKTLFEAWQRKNEADSLRLSPDEERRYALRYGDPTKASDKPKTELGANALAGAGLACFWMAARVSGWRQVGYSGSRAEGEITWPVFRTPNGVSLEVIRAIMALEEITAAHPLRSDLEPLGIAELFRARRFVLDPQKGDYGNVSSGRSLWGAW